MHAPISKFWIDTQLSRKQRAMLVEYLLERTTSPTGSQIIEAIEELFPGKQAPSIRSANTWKEKSWNFEIYLRRLSEDNEAAKIIADHSTDIADANKKLVDGYVFQELRKLTAPGEKPDPKIHAWIQAASHLATRTVNDTRTRAALEKSQKQNAILQQKIDEHNRKEAERKAAFAKLSEKAKGAITPELIEEAQILMGLKQ